MQHPRIVVGAIGIALAASVGGVAAAAGGGSSSSGAQPGKNPAAATVHTASAAVGGKTETILVDGHGMPLYYYQPDTASTSSVTGQLAKLWPALTSASPNGSVSGGTLSSVGDVHGSQVAYNGHLLYTFVSDQSDRVTGEGVQNFFVATPGLAPVAGSHAPAPAVPPSSSSSSYGY